MIDVHYLPGVGGGLRYSRRATVDPVALVTGGLLLAGIAAAVLGPLLAALLIRRNDAGPTDAGATVALALTILAVSAAAVSAVAMFVLAWRRTVRTPHGRHRKGRAS
ncbi:hypothetical protein ACWEVD_23995 [Nocardia thailandica]